jgi:hypothetical protein
MAMGGHQVQSHGTGDDGYDEDGYDESQRAEILEATVGGPGNGTLLTDLQPDLGAEIDADEDEDDILLAADDIAGESIRDPDEDDDEIEDSLQEDFDGDAIDDDDLDDSESTALNP